MNFRSLKLLELDKVIDKLRQKCATPMGEELVKELTPHTKYGDVVNAQAQTREAYELLEKESPPMSGLLDIRHEAIRAGKGGVLDPMQLYSVNSFLDGSMALKKFISKIAPKDSWIDLAAQGLLELPKLAADLRRAVDRDGNVLDTASSDLRSIRRKLDGARSRLRDKVDSMVKSSTIQKFLQEPLVTQRDGRYCLPVKSEHRANVPGVVHDQSASGATLFIEPLAAVETTNQITSLEREEQAEVQRILRELSLQVGSYKEDIIMAVEAAGEIDFAFARAKLAISQDATGPDIREDNRLEIISGRHPLLPGKEVVPTTITLGGEYSALVITGPNTGGKTVTLKTVGLFCLMAQCGLWLPASFGSSVPVFSNIFADIGDEQSIEQSLSTFSGHMTNIVKILQEADDRSLVLLDELGAGTDPAEGAALATALLDRFKQLGASVVATTHYSELKAYAWTEPGVQNASVEFDVETLRPTYRLLIGTPGKSNAFEIALRLGLDPQVVDASRRLLHSDARRTEDLLAALEQKRLEAERNLEQAREDRLKAEELRKGYQQRVQRLESQQEKLLEKAREKSNELIKNAKHQAEELLAQLRQARTDANVDDLARQTREKLKPIATERKEKPSSGQAPDPNKLKPGQEVKVLSLDKKATVLSVNSPQDVLVQVGIMKVTVKISDIRLTNTQKTAPQESKGRNTANTGSTGISMELDVRGKLVDEACLDVDKYLDAAMLGGLNQVSIIHGKGTGALGRGLQEYLRTHSAVSSFRYGGAGEGGSGVTVVQLKE